jgi:MFS family permease
LSWRDGRIRQWIVAGVVAGHAQAATLTCIGFFIIDVLKLEPLGAEQPIAIVMMAGAGGTLAAQWGLIPKLGLSPRALIVWGALIAALGLGVTAVASDLYGLVLGFGLASIGFGFTRPGFTAGASLAVPLAEQGAVAGVITSANGIAYVLAPAAGMAMYALDPHLPFAVAVLVVVTLAWWGRSLR